MVKNCYPKETLFPCGLKDVEVMSQRPMIYKAIPNLTLKCTDTANVITHRFSFRRKPATHAHEESSILGGLIPHCNQTCPKLSHDCYIKTHKPTIFIFLPKTHKPQMINGAETDPKAKEIEDSDVRSYSIS